jgi:hypothetical protein
LAPGTSAQYPTYHGPSCSTIAVNSLRISLFYRRGGGAGFALIRGRLGRFIPEAPSAVAGRNWGFRSLSPKLQRKRPNM